MNILAITANPDDAEFLCAGTLAMYSKKGHGIFICYLTTGDKGSETLSSKEMVAIRKKESENSAKLINAKLFPLNIPDGEVVMSLELRCKIIGVMRKVCPDVIITHYDKDYMSDHNTTSKLVADAAFWSMVSNFKGIPETKGKHSRPKVLYNMDTLGGISFQPQEYVDITSVIDIKIEMLSQHKSQLQYMKERDGMDFIDYMLTSAKYRGYQCGVKYAEGFIAVKRYPFLTTKRLLP